LSRSRSIRTGFQVAVTNPAILAAEITWRWLFGLLAWSLAFFLVLAWLHSIKVSNADLFGLGFSPLAPAAIEHIMRGSGPLLVRAIEISLAAAIILWCALATMGRAAILRALIGRASFASVLGIHAIRSLAAAIACAIYVVCAISLLRLAGQGHAALKLLLILLVLLTSWLWSVTAWQLELATIISASESLAPASAITRSVEFSRQASRQFLWASSAVGVLRFVIAIAAWSLFASIASITVEAPHGSGWAALAIAVLMWSIFDDFLHIWRLAAYIRIIHWWNEASRVAESNDLPTANSETTRPQTSY
jgi:hypothetical protein